MAIFKSDPGLAYLKKINFQKAKGPHGLINSWNKRFGYKKAEELWKKFEKLPGASPEFYEFKNSDPVISQTFSEAYDGEIIRKACNYISDHRDAFGPTILEIGCDTGYMTGFLALTFPNAKIVAIERGKSAIKMAEEHIRSLGVTNVEIRNCALSDVNGTFDTVFCMRTLQENTDHEHAPFGGMPIIQQTAYYTEATGNFTNEIKKCLKDSGTLCAFERICHDPLLLGWLIQLNGSKIGINLESHQEISCMEGASESIFQAFICQNGQEIDPGIIMKKWREGFTLHTFGNHELTGWNALIYLQENAGELLQGFYVVSKEGDIVGRFAAFKDKDGEPLVYYLMAIGGHETKMISVAESGKDSVFENMEGQRKNNKSVGHKIVPISSEEDYLEGSE